MSSPKSRSPLKFRGTKLAITATPMTIGTKIDGINYKERTAVRAILQNPETKRIVIIHVSKGDYYKLPGGGLEGDEDHLVALGRELAEETGCKATIDENSCIGKVEEFRNDLNQMSFCYVAKLVEDTGRRALTDQEAAEGLTHAWVSVPEAAELMKGSKPTSELGASIKQRDLNFVEKFAKLQGIILAEERTSGGILGTWTWEQYLRRSRNLAGSLSF